MKLNSQEKRDLDKFAKFLALKATQIIIQSRQGEKASTVCKPQITGSDWFNLSVTDIPEVLAEAKKVLNGKILSPRLPLCVEISLITSESDQMVLEAWCLGLSPEKCDATPRITKTIYNRIGILLKSLVTTTRFVPAYKLSRMQGLDSFVLCYRIYMGEPLEQCLGEGYKHAVIGKICSPIGTFQLSVSYRTKLTISPTQSERNNEISAVHDQLNSNSDPTLLKKKNCKAGFEQMKLPPFADPSKLKTLEEMKHLLIPDIPESLKRLLEEETRESDEDGTEIGGTEQKEIKNEESSDEYKMDLLTIDSSTDSNDDFIMVNPLDRSRIEYYIVEWRKPKPLESFSDLSPIEESESTMLFQSIESDWSEYEELNEVLNEID